MAGRMSGHGAERLHATVFHPRLVGGSLDSIFWQGYVQPLLSDASCRCVCFDPQVSWQRQALSAMEEAWQACKEEPPGYEFAVRQACPRLFFCWCKTVLPRRRSRRKSLSGMPGG